MSFTASLRLPCVQMCEMNPTITSGSWQCTAAAAALSATSTRSLLLGANEDGRGRLEQVYRFSHSITHCASCGQSGPSVSQKCKIILDISRVLSTSECNMSERRLGCRDYDFKLTKRAFHRSSIWTLLRDERNRQYSSIYSISVKCCNKVKFSYACEQLSGSSVRKLSSTANLDCVNAPRTASQVALRCA